MMNPLQYHNATQEAVALLCSLIATPSLSRSEKGAADIMQAWMKERGIAATRIGNNIITQCKDHNSALPTLLLNAHLDTVKPAAGWQRNPYVPTMEGQKLYGLGSNDCGGGLVSLLQAYRILSQSKQPYNLIYLASAEEEVSGKDGFSLVLPLLPHIDVAIVGEPTSMQPAIAEKGLMVLDIVTKGEAGHAARNEGINAIYKALDQINWIRNYRFKKLSPMLGEMKMTTTIIQAGTLHNCIPDQCSYTVDVRTTDCYTNQEILEFISSQLDAQVKARSTRLGSSSISSNHPIVKQCIAMGMKPFGSPTLSDQALMPFASLKLGPGESQRSHCADEYIEVGEIEDAIKTYIDLLDGLDIQAPHT